MFEPTGQVSMNREEGGEDDRACVYVTHTQNTSLPLISETHDNSPIVLTLLISHFVCKIDRCILGDEERTKET